MTGRRRLLSDSDVPVFELINKNGAADVLLICDHASNRIPQSLERLGLTGSALEQHIAWDVGAAAVTRQLSKRLDAAAVLAGYSRLVVDANRRPGDLSAMPEISDGIHIPGNLGLDSTARQQRTDELFWPYHGAVSDHLASIWQRGTPPILLSIHSFTPAMNGEQRPWHIGILWNRDPRLAHLIMQTLEARPEGYRVGDNLPYAGTELAYSLDFHAGVLGLAHCVVEIRQDLIATPEGVTEWSSVLEDVMEEIGGEPTLHDVIHF